MKIKKMTSMFMLGITAFSAIPQSAYAIDTKLESNMEASHRETYTQVYGQVANISEEGQILIKNSTNVNNEILLNVSEETVIVDAVTGTPASVKDITLNEGIYTYIGQVMTLSLPPMTNAKVIIVNVPQDTKAPTYIKVEAIKKNNDGSTTVISEGRTYEATLNNNTKIFPYRTKNIVRIDDIQVGSNLLLWEDVNPDKMQTLELPQKMEVSKCMIMPQDAVETTEAMKKDGWMIENNKWYYIKDNDNCKGWIKDNNKWYYMDKNGVMQTGWVKDNNKWYYLNEDGSMKTGWLLNNGEYYYLKVNGEMVTNESIDGYYLGANGAWVK